MKLYNGFAKLPIQSNDRKIHINIIIFIHIFNRHMEKYVNQVIPHQFSARRTSDRSLLGLNDLIKYVLDDNESVEIGKISMTI